MRVFGLDGGRSYSGYTRPRMGKPFIVIRSSITSVIALVLATVVASAQTPPQPDPKDPQYQAKGEQSRTYMFPGTGESIAYHLYVPTKWTKTTKLPLVVVTHGANQPSTAPFQRPMANQTLAKAAEERGYIVAAVTGYHANATGVGGWNVPYQMVQVQNPNPGGGGGGGRGGGRGPAQAPPTPEDFQGAEQAV